MEKWKRNQAFKIPTNAAERPLTIAALIKDPTGPWFGYLSMQTAEARFQLRSLQGQARQNAAAGVVRWLKQADQALESASSADTANTSLREIRQELQRTLAPFQLESGPAYLTEVRKAAQQMLDQNKDTNSWNYGNVVYEANSLLGRAALREGQAEQARSCLRAAGRSPGSPQLRSYGPDLVFARELLEHGDQEDREAVLAFLQDIARFHGNPDPRNANSQRVAADHLKDLESWQQQIRDGKIPTDRQWR